jgi:hypothetical protein
MAAGDSKSIDKGSTGRFVPCVAGEWSHPHQRVAHEVRWSITKNNKTGRRKKNFYFHCGFCNSQTFLNDWADDWGLTIVQVEQRGLIPSRINAQRRAELLAELGLRVAVPKPLKTKKK